MLGKLKEWLCANDAESSCSNDIMARLGIMVFRHDVGGRWRRASPVADWVSSFVKKGRVVVGDARDLPFDFLAIFLDECDQIIKRDESLTDDAEIWHERDKNGDLHSFSARLFKLDDAPHLLVQSLDDTFDKKQEMFQRAREQTLTLEALAKAEAALRESKQKLELIMRQAPALFWCADIDGILTYCSGSALHAFGFCKESGVGRSVLELFQESDASQKLILSAHDSAVVGEAFTFGTQCGERSFDVRVEPLYDTSRSKVVGTSGVCVESTERVKAEKNAAAALQAKTDFVTGISHEIRTPMNAIIGLTELTLDLPLKKEQEVYLQSAISAGESLLSVVDQLLDFSGIETGWHEVESMEFSVSALIYDVLTELAVHAHSKGIELVSIVGDDVPAILCGDRGRLRQILINLVGNAVKFTAKGEVQVRVKLESANASTPNVMLHFSVCDSGIGVPPEKQELIFDAFRQTEYNTICKYGGTGLGLSMASQLTNLLGGKIWIVSPGEDGIGSEFHFTVVVRAEKDTGSAESACIAEAEFPSSCILVGMQGSATSEINRILTNMLGHVAKITIAHDVSGGVDIPAVDASGVLVLEIPAEPNARSRMLESLRGVRDSKSAVIATSAVGIPPSDMEDLRTFCDCILLKPINVDELRRALLESSKHKNLEINLPEIDVIKPLRILVADSNDLNQWVIASICRNRGHEVTLVSNGMDAVKLTGRRSFDLLLLDIKMSDIDGYEVARRIRGLEKSASPRGYLPVIALATKENGGTREECSAAGMDGYLLKPVRLKALFHMIEKVLEAKKGVYSGLDAVRSDALDIELPGKSTGIDAKKEMLIVARSMLATTLDEVEEGLGNMSFETIEKGADRIKDVAVEVGASDLAAVADRLKQMASIQNIDGGRACLIELRSESDRLRSKV